jgi:competence protein ComEC
MYLTVISLSWISGIILGLFFDLPFPLIITSFTPVICAIFYKNQTKHLIVGSICLILFWSGAFYAQSSMQDNNELYSLNNPEITQVKGQVDFQPEVKDTLTHLELSITEIKVGASWYASGGKILVFIPQYPEYRYGDILGLSGRLENPPVFDDFDYQSYLAKDDIYFVMYSPQIEIIKRITGFNFHSWIYTFRESLSKSLSSTLPEPQASLAQGIILGSRNSIPDSLRTNLSITGTAHILAISGVNLTIVAGMLVTLGIWFFGRRHHIYIWLSLLIIWFYLLITGMQTSVIRAAIMASIFLIAELLGRQKNVLVALIFTAAIMVGINPRILFEVSFQLSFTAMMGLIFIAPILQNHMRKFVSRLFNEINFAARVSIMILDSFCITLGAIIAVWPIIAYNFKIISIVGPLATVLIAPVLLPVIILGAITAIVGIFSLQVAQALGWGAWIFLSYMIILVNAFACLPFAVFTTGIIESNFICIYYSILAIIIWIIKEYKRVIGAFKASLDKAKLGFDHLANNYARLPVKLIVITLLITAYSTTFNLALWPDNNLHVSILDVGEGDSILIQNGNQNILIDGGPSPQAVCLELSRKLTFWNRRLDLVILTHPHLDHLNGLIEVIKRFKVNKF